MESSHGRGGIRLLNSLGIAGVDEAVLAQLRRKNPPRHEELPTFMADGDTRPVDLTETFRTLRRRAGSPNGMRNEYLRALTATFDDPRAASVMSLFNNYATWLVGGGAPSWYYMLWSSGLLIPLVKKEPREPGGTPDVRPIVCGDAERRAVERTVARQTEAAFAEYLTPQQVAVGVEGGPSKLTLGLQLTMEMNPQFVCIKMDMKNGYNAIWRKPALLALRRVPSLRGIIPLIHNILGPKSLLFVGRKLERLFQTDGDRWDTTGRGDSEEGFHQGGALSSGCFCVAIHEGVKRLDRACAAAGGGARFLMDDGYAFGPAEVVFPAVEAFAAWLLETLGLELQFDKSMEVPPVTPPSARPFATAQRPPRGRAPLFGSPRAREEV